jgi:hypothetical protein
MNKILILIAFLILPLVSQATMIQIQPIRDNKGVLQRYHVITWSGPDESMVITPYTIAEAQTKFAGLLTKNQSGTTTNPDRIILNYNDAGDLISMEFQVTSGKFERQIFKGEAIPAATKTDATATKTDVETKIGKDIGGGPIKPPKAEPVGEVEVIP